MTDDADEEGLTYAETGVDIDASEAATAALVGASLASMSTPVSA